MIHPGDLGISVHNDSSILKSGHCAGSKVSQGEPDCDVDSDHLVDQCCQQALTGEFSELPRSYYDHFVDILHQVDRGLAHLCTTCTICSGEKKPQSEAGANFKKLHISPCSWSLCICADFGAALAGANLQ